MTRFTDRVERDLTQISDQATPSSSAWEAIRHRIDEQDSQPHRDTTTEVIMLDPDTNRLQRRPRTGLLVAASVAALALVGGLVVVANRDDSAPPADRPDPTPTVVVTDPAIAGDPEPVVVDPELPTDPETAPEGEALPPVGPPSQGVFVPTCTTDDGVPDPENGRLVVEQNCTIVGVDAQPFNAEQVVELSLLENVGTEETPAGAFVALGDNGFMNAGLLWDEGTKGRWVGIAEGVGDYEGEPVFLSAISTQNADGSLDELDGQWWTTDGPRPAFDAVDVTAEITFECILDLTTAEQSCNYDGDDPRFVPEREVHDLQTMQVDFATTGNGTGSVAESAFFTSTNADQTSLRVGIVTASQYPRFTDVRPGTGEFEGSLIVGNGWGEATTPGGLTTRGVIQLTVVPIGS